MYAYFEYLAGLLMVFLLVQAAPFDTIGTSHAIQLADATGISAVPAAGFAPTTSLAVDLRRSSGWFDLISSLLARLQQSPLRRRKETYTVTCGSDEDTYVMTTTITKGIGQAMPRAAKKGKPKHKGSDEKEESLKCQDSSEPSEELSALAIALITLGCVIGTAISQLSSCSSSSVPGAGSPLRRRARDEPSP
ncbi:hypothetical protein DL767_005371 [Monosporascus sp. MG133]|nr:hypothetical protein DL767_005371 [Monosporascus sp. MG133]